MQAFIFVLKENVIPTVNQSPKAKIKQPELQTTHMTLKAEANERNKRDSGNTYQ